MPKPDKATVSGEVRDVFAHRFVVATAAGAILADLGPELARGVHLKPGDKVEIAGAQKTSELKVERLTLNGAPVPLDHDEQGEDEPVDPRHALDAVKAAGSTVVAEPREKPRHFEILAKDKDGQHLEYHVHHDGEIKRSKPGDAADKKWKRSDGGKA